MIDPRRQFGGRLLPPSGDVLFGLSPKVVTTNLPQSMIEWLGLSYGGCAKGPYTFKGIVIIISAG